MTVSYSDYRLGTRLGRSKDQTRKNFALNTIACKISGYHRAASYQAQFNHAKIMLKWAREAGFCLRHYQVVNGDTFTGELERALF